MVVRDEMDVCVEFAVDLSWDTYPPFNPQQPPQTTLLLDQTLGETSSKCTTTARTRLLETSTWPSADLQLGRARARRTRFGRRHCFSMGDTVTGQEQLSRPRRRSRRTTWSGGAPSARLGAPAHINPLFISTSPNVATTPYGRPDGASCCRSQHPLVSYPRDTPHATGDKSRSSLDQTIR